MKKLAAFILLLTYFIFSTGFVVSVHWCMNKVDSVQWGDTTSDECGKCGMHIQRSGGCCKDDVKVMKVQIDQTFAKVLSPDFSLAPVLSTVDEYYLSSLQSGSQLQSPLAHGPPLPEDDLFLQNRVFRL